MQKQDCALNDRDNHIHCDNSKWTPPTKAVLNDQSNGWHHSGVLIDGFYSMYQPEVIYVPEWDTEDNYPYRMWFFAWAYTQENDPCEGYEGYPGGDAMFTARAKDPLGPWEVYAKDENGFFWDRERRRPRRFQSADIPAPPQDIPPASRRSILPYRCSPTH